MFVVNAPFLFVVVVVVIVVIVVEKGEGREV